MQSIVINECYGGFGLSKEAVIRYGELKGLNLVIVAEDSHVKGFSCDHYYTNGVIDDNTYFDPSYDINRNDPALIQVVREMGEAANGDFAELKIVDINDGIDWHIDRYDGMECVCESHNLED